jgi:hypothetical protein
MHRQLKAVALLLAAALCVASPAFAHSKSQFHDAMRKLWVDHVAWTRLYIVSATGGLPDAQLAADRLLKNQKDIGDAVADFYGRPAADQLTALLKDHILVAAELVGAAKAGDQAKTADAKKRWYDNANDIAAFLNKANPDHWPLATLQSMMKTHLDQTLNEATFRLQGKHAEEIAEYDAIVEHILKMADALSGGIMAQFPQKFDQA